MLRNGIAELLGPFLKDTDSNRCIFVLGVLEEPIHALDTYLFSLFVVLVFAVEFYGILRMFVALAFG